MSIDARLNKLMPALSARERAILVLESWKAGEQEDPKWRSMMPDGQRVQFNRLIELMNGSVIQVGQCITILEQMVDKLELRQCWLVALVLWDEQLSAIDRAVRLGVKEPISQSVYNRKQKELDEEWVPVSELAGVLADKHENWAESDYESVEGWDEPVISDAAWDRVAAEKDKVIRAAVASGKLVGRGRGKGLQVQEGAFNAWAGSITTPRPDNLWSYRVIPDAELAADPSEREAIQRLQEALDWRPLRVKDDPEQTRVLDVLAGHLRRSIAAMYADLWQTYQAVEIVLREVSEEFDGADPIRPAKRETLDLIRRRLVGLGEQFILLDVEVEMPEPDEELLGILRKLVWRD